PTKEGVIVIGVAPRNPLRQSLGASGLRPTKPIPSRLPAVDATGQFVAAEEVIVIVEDTGEVVDDINTTRNRPCQGGFSVGRPLAGAGTFGGNVRLGANFGYILSNNHVLAAYNTGAVGDPIIQPADGDGGDDPGDRIAQLTRWVPIDFSGGNNE